MLDGSGAVADVTAVSALAVALCAANAAVAWYFTTPLLLVAFAPTRTGRFRTVARRTGTALLLVPPIVVTGAVVGGAYIVTEGRSGGPSSASPSWSASARQPWRSGTSVEQSGGSTTIRSPP